MARSRPETTKYPGVYKRTIYQRDGGKGITVYDLKINGEWSYRISTNLEDARKERERLVAELQGGGSLSGRQQTIRTFADNTWLPRMEDRVKYGRLRPQTLEGYRRDLENHVLPALGTRRLGDLSVGEVQGFADELGEKGKAPLTVLNVLKPLGSIYRLAKKQRIVTFNPVANVEKPPARRQRDPVELTAAQVQKLAAKATTVDDRNLILLAALTGLRFSEAAGLRWEDVELSPERPKLRVTTQHYRGRTGEPKTRSARREIDLAEQAVQVLRSQHVESTRSNELGLVFPSGDGKHIHASNWNRREWADIRSAANLPDVHFHDLRSFFVSEAKAAGLAEPVTQQLVGHADGRVHARYSYAVEGTDAITRRRLTERFSRFTLE